MGFSWSGLGKIAAGIGGIVAAIPTGGASLAATIPLMAGSGAGILSGIGDLASKGSAGRATGRIEEASLTQGQDQAAMQRYQALQQATLDARRLSEQGLMSRAQLDALQRQIGLAQRQYQLQAPGARASNAVRGDTLANVQDVNVSYQGRLAGYVPTVTGGLRPSLLSPQTRQLGRSMTEQALMQQLQGDNFDPMELPPSTDFEGAVMQPPELSGLPEAGDMDSILNTIGTIGNVAGVIGGVGTPQGGPEQTTAGQYANQQMPPPDVLRFLSQQPFPNPPQSTDINELLKLLPPQQVPR